MAAIKYLDYICSDEGQVLVQWGIEGVNYFLDEKDTVTARKTK